MLLPPFVVARYAAESSMVLPLFVVARHRLPLTPALQLFPPFQQRHCDIMTVQLRP
jgi:hypothetical protein